MGVSHICTTGIYYTYWFNSEHFSIYYACWNHTEFCLRYWIFQDTIIKQLLIMCCRTLHRQQAIELICRWVGQYSPWFALGIKSDTLNWGGEESSEVLMLFRILGDFGGVLRETFQPNVLNAVQDSEVHGANMGPIWVLSAPDGPHVDPILSGIELRDTIFGLQDGPPQIPEVEGFVEDVGVVRNYANYDIIILFTSGLESYTVVNRGEVIC